MSEKPTGPFEKSIRTYYGLDDAKIEPLAKEETLEEVNPENLSTANLIDKQFDDAITKVQNPESEDNNFMNELANDTGPLTKALKAREQ